MITVLTSHNHIWDKDKVVAGIVKEYQTNGQVVISMNNEGPCNDSVGLYRLLDMLCETFGFDPKNITIITSNREELSDRYNIEIRKNHWIFQTYQSAVKNGFVFDDFKNKKFPVPNLFGCLYNIPSWNRLSLLSYIKYNTTNQSLLACNGTWQPEQHNSYYLSPVTDFSPEEIFNIVKLIQDGIGPLPNHPGHKPDENENTKILNLYNDFLIDVVAETYTNGLTFFPTEKTFRPMFALTPFIAFGPQAFLNTLKSDFGFKTFSDWWSEDYDNYQNYDRIKKMYSTISYIDSMSKDNLEAMYMDMQPTLEHNFNRLKELGEKPYRAQ